ncbi:uncharacterized protein LOC127738990 isoform X1 [Mytilus californianus]|uniref:uncharacterized protein LOC127738990 isoform X1 n=1 Tax=Mytilus californianus TaxID=6549 RepID=UPI00224709D4|nr:uncharacterized protein LOC127738990 isoform X1 [Mytilus californianus]
MASSDRNVCTLCYDDGTSTEAVTWCTECEVFLCTDCEKHHKRSRTSKEHKTISSTEYHKLPQFMLDISSQCKDHKKKFELYCSFHACPCCVTCITDKHQKCQEMKPLSDIIKQVKSSAFVQLLEKDLKNVKENFEEIIKCLNSRIEISNSHKQKAAEEIRSMRKSIDDYLNKIEKDILDDLESKQSNIKSEINTLLQQLTQRANEISQLESEFSKMTQYATELQMYVGLREIEKATSQAAKYIEDLISGNEFEEINLNLNISSELESILKDVKSFGDIYINTRPCTLELKAGRKDQAQNLVLTIPRIEQIKPSMLKKLAIPEDILSMNIRACRLLPDGKYLIIDNQFYTGHLLLFSNAGMFLKEVVAFNGCSFDTCILRNNTVAVTLGLEKQIAFVEIEKNNIIRTIHFSHVCDAIASDGQMLVISSMEKSTLVNLTDESHTILEGVVADRVALFNESIYGTLYKAKQVNCYTSTGEPLWTFQHQDIVSPRELALDKNGFVYIASRGNNSIVVVSPDGKTLKTILSEADGIKHPYAIDINRETGIMIVSSHIRDHCEEDLYQTAFVYKI